MRDFSSVLHKLDRADVHIGEATRIFQGLIKSQTYPTATERDRNGWFLVKLSGVLQPPPELSLAIGDAAHCVRSALDHLAFAFAKKIPGKENRSVQFPICSSPEKFLEQRTGRLKNVHRSARSRMEQFQPYHRRKYPQARSLAALREIDDMDKHRLLPFTEVRVKRVELTPIVGLPLASIRGYKGRMEVGAVLARFKPAHATANGKVKVNMVCIPIFGKNVPKEIQGVTAINSIIDAKNFIVTEIIPAFRGIK